MTETTFAPGAEVTREQLARFLAVYSEKVLGLDATPEGTSLPDKFTDKNKVSSWAKENIIWAVENGIISGTTDTTISPRSTGTRAQMAQMLKTYSANIAGGMTSEVMERKTAITEPGLT